MRNFDYIKLSEKKWDTDILNLVAKIHECKGRQDLFIRQKPTELDRLTEIAKIQSTEASNRIEGIKTTDTRMRQLFAEKTMPKNRDEDEIMGYRDVLNTIHDRHDYIPVQPAYILQLHRDLMKRAGVSYGGHFKNVQNYINETLEDGTVITRFTPVAPFETPAAIEMICDAYARASKAPNSQNTSDHLNLVTALSSKAGIKLKTESATGTHKFFTRRDVEKLETGYVADPLRRWICNI
jgi:Fic family protein